VSLQALGEPPLDLGQARPPSGEAAQLRARLVADRLTRIVGAGLIVAYMALLS
jgi:hypothetical protein